MSDEANIKAVVDIINQVPTKELKLVKILNKLPIVKGELDFEAVTNQSKKIVDALSEAEGYGEATEKAVRNIEEALL